MKLRPAGAFYATWLFIGLLSTGLESSAYFVCTTANCASILILAGISIFSVGLVALAVAAVLWRNGKVL